MNHDQVHIVSNKRLTSFSKSTFSASSYAAFRPTYPASLYQAVLSYHQGPRNLCLDYGCGTGIATRRLAPSFASIIGTDPSKGMVEQARQNSSKTEYPNIDYRIASAENSPFVDAGTVDMITAAQAAHWFDYPRFFADLHRIVRKGGTFAVWGYKDNVFVDYPNATDILNRYAYGKDKALLGSYWPAGREIVQDKLRAIKPPESQWEDVRRIEYEPGTQGKGSGEGTMFLNRRLKVGECKEYVRTWSSFHGWKEAHPDREAKIRGGSGDVVDVMFDEMAEQNSEFADEETEVEVEWGSALVMARKK